MKTKDQEHSMGFIITLFILQLIRYKLWKRLKRSLKDMWVITGCNIQVELTNYNTQL